MALCKRVTWLRAARAGCCSSSILRYHHRQHRYHCQQYSPAYTNRRARPHARPPVPRTLHFAQATGNARALRLQRRPTDMGRVLFVLGQVVLSGKGLHHFVHALEGIKELVRPTRTPRGEHDSRQPPRQHQSLHLPTGRRRRLDGTAIQTRRRIGTMRRRRLREQQHRWTDKRWCRNSAGQRGAESRARRRGARGYWSLGIGSTCESRMDRGGAPPRPGLVWHVLAGRDNTSCFPFRFGYPPTPPATLPTPAPDS